MSPKPKKPKDHLESEVKDKLENTEKKKMVLKFPLARKLMTEKRRELLQTLN